VNLKTEKLLKLVGSLVCICQRMIPSYAVGEVKFILIAWYGAYLVWHHCQARHVSFLALRRILES
jgi:hypothetical protein